MKKHLGFLSLILACIMLFSSIPLASAASEPITIVLPTYKTGENVGAVFFEPQIARFNEKYAGQYKIVLEELTQDQYNDKMKQLAIQGQLPAMIEGGDSEWMRTVVVPNRLFYDLTTFLQDNPEVDSHITDWDRAYNTTEDGQYVSIVNGVVRPIGLYYNEALLPLSKKPGEYASWDELLAELGDKKIAFGTGENAWTIALVYTSLIAAEEGGAKLLSDHQIDKLTNFDDPALAAATEKLQYILQNYATPNTVGAVYADSANAFMSNQGALIANGSWMVGDFAPNATDKWSNGFDGGNVRGDVFPGNIAIAGTTGSYNWWIAGTATDEEYEVASAFLAFINSQAELEAYMLAEGGTSTKLTLSEEFLQMREASNPLLNEYVTAVNENTLLVPNILDCIPSSVAANGFGSLLPKLIDGSYTAEEFLAQMTVLAKEATE